MAIVTFYTRKNCCLCHDALAIVREVQTQIPFELQLIDVDQHEQSRAQYGALVPVIAVNNRVEFTYRVHAQQLQMLLSQSPSGEQQSS